MALNIIIRCLTLSSDLAPGASASETDRAADRGDEPAAEMLDDETSTSDARCCVFVAAGASSVEPGVAEEVEEVEEVEALRGLRPTRPRVPADEVSTGVGVPALAEGLGLLRDGELEPVELDVEVPVRSCGRCTVVTIESPPESCLDSGAFPEGGGVVVPVGRSSRGDTSDCVMEDEAEAVSLVAAAVAAAVEQLTPCRRSRGGRDPCIDSHYEIVKRPW